MLKRAAEYEPERVADFICALYAELDIEGKAHFKAVLWRFFLDSTPTPNEEEKVEN